MQKTLLFTFMSGTCSNTGEEIHLPIQQLEVDVDSVFYKHLKLFWILLKKLIILKISLNVDLLAHNCC